MYTKIVSFFFNLRKTKDVKQEEERISHLPSVAGREGVIHEFSDTWIFVTNWATAELEQARERNDSHKRDAVQTAALRGRIELLKELLELPRPKERRRRSAADQEHFE